VCLQELKTSDEKFPAEAIRKAGYGAIWHGQKSYNGVAVLARRKEPLERRRGLPGILTILTAGISRPRWMES
jgi:exodeoxyribonuclease-3